MQGLFLPRLLDALLATVQRSLALCLIGELLSSLGFCKFRGSPSALFLIDEYGNNESPTGFLSLSKSQILLVEVLLLFLRSLERLRLASYNSAVGS
jgi:hypothetical protein